MADPPGSTQCAPIRHPLTDFIFENPTSKQERLYHLDINNVANVFILDDVIAGKTGFLSMHLLAMETSFTFRI